MNIIKIVTLILSSFILLFNSTIVLAETLPHQALGIHLEGYRYPYPVNYFTLNIEGKKLKMAYMDVPPSGKSRNQTIVLLHGGLAFGAYWKDTIHFLSKQGFRVIVPDQIGFGKSSKENIHYSPYLLAKNTKELLDHLSVNNAIIVGHSLGGMLAMRFTLMYPNKVSKLVLEDPLGLEDYRLKIPYKSVDEIYKLSLHPTWESILNSHQALYARWNEKYAEYALAIYRISLNPQYPKVAFVQALIYQMLYVEPIMYELANIKVPTLLLFGDQDRVAPGKGFASADMQKTLGNFPVLTKHAATVIPNVKVIGLKNVGHVPHLEATQQFNTQLLEFIAGSLKDPQ